MQKPYEVRLSAMVPINVTMFLEAESEKEALEKAFAQVEHEEADYSNACVENLDEWTVAYIIEGPDINDQPEVPA